MAQQYSNRTDLQNPVAKMAATAAKGQTYGEAGKQIAAQQAVPMGSAPTDVQAAQTPQAPTPMPGQIADLTGNTERPNEPITAGMNFGPGPSAAIFGQPLNPAPGSNQALAEQVRAIASLYPNPALLQLAMELEA
jgi:hypothetical protein